jgi:transcriptional regulator with XRE-family HTH domain
MGFGEALRAIRVEAGMTQRDLADVSGVHQTTISSVEAETRTPTIKVLLPLCEGLAVTPDQLFRRAGMLPAEGEFPDEGFWELWGVWKRLTAGERQIVSEFARFWEGRRG